MDNVTIGVTKKENIPYIEEKLKKYALDSTDIDWQQFFVAKLENKCVAFGRIIDHGEYFELASLGVDWYHRKKGIGAKMFRFLIGQTTARDKTKPIYIVTHRHNYFSKFGFRDVAVFPDYLGCKRTNKCLLDPSKLHVMKYTK